MDGSNWKRILLHWANQTCLLERVYYNIEQTDVDVFFEKFRSQMKTVPMPQTDLLLFLKEKYPDFEVHLDDGNNLCSSDYMYVYSLLLHYSCVKCPEPFFHEACQSLPEQFQQAIASFFKILIESDRLNRELLRHAIHTSSPKSPIRFMPLESPIRTPRSKLSPPTPKTSMLEERTKELNLLKAQLESERYEKGFVELQLKQNEEKIQKLTQEQKANQTEIFNLKNELLAKHTENHSPSRNSEEEQIKKRLRRDIAEKEEAILNLRENLESLGEEKKLLLDKLSYAESQVGVCLDKIKEMDYLINELRSEIEKRDLAIQTLTETKNELELFISESRSSSQGGRNDFNMSAECLDVSLSRTTNSSGSVISSPENLGVSVVDIKLREKEQENIILTEKIEQMKADCEKLSKHVFELVVRYANTFDICNENLVVTDDADLTHTFVVFENYIEKMVESFTMASTNLKLVKQENADIQAQNTVVNNKISGLEDQLDACRKQLESLKFEKAELEEKNSFYSVQCTMHQEKIEDLSQKLVDVQSRLDTFNEEYENHKSSFSGKVYELTEQNFKLETRLNETLNNLQRLTDEKSQIEADKRNLQEKVFQLNRTLEEYSETIKVLGDSNQDLLSSIATHIEQVREDGEKNNELQSKMEKLELAIEMLNEEKNALLEEKATIRTKLDTTESELTDLRVKNANELENNQHLKNEIVKLSKTLDDTLNELQEKSSRIRELEEQLANSNQKIVDHNATIAELMQRRDYLVNGCRILEESIAAMKVKIIENSDDIKSIQEDYKNDQKQMELELESIRRESDEKEENYKNIIENLNSVVKRLNEDNHEIEQRNFEKSNEAEQLRDELVKLTNEKTEVEKQLIEKKLLEQKCESVVSNNAELKSGLISLLNYLKCQDSSGGDSAVMAPNNMESPLKCLRERISSMLKTNTDLSKLEVELRSIIADLKNQLSELKKSSDGLKKDYEKLSIGEVECKIRINCLEEEKISLNVKIDELKHKLGELEESKVDLERKNSQYEADTNKLLGDLNALASEKNSLSEKVSSLQTKETALEEAVRKLEAQVADYVVIENKLSETEKYLEEASEKQLVTDELLEKQIAIIESLQKERENLDEQLSVHLKRAFDDEEKMQNLQDKNIDLTIQLHQLANEIAIAKLTEEKHQSSLHENEATKKQLQEKEKSLQIALQDIQDLNESLATLKSSQEELEKAAVDRELKLNALEKEILDHEGKINELNNITQINSDIVEMRSIIENLKQNINDKDAAIDEWRKLLQTADAESKQLSENYKETVESLENRINDLENERTFLLNGNNTIKENLAEMESSLKQTQSVNVEFLSKIDELKASLSETTERETDYINLQLRYVAVTAEKEQLMSSKQKLEENCTKLTKRVEKLSIKVGDLQANANKLDKMNVESRNELETLQKTFQHNKNQMDDLRHKVDASQKDLKAASEEVNKLRKALADKTSKNSALMKELEETCKGFETDKHAMQRELKVATERASSLQTLYNEEVEKTVALNLELQQLGMQLDKKLSEIEDRDSFLSEIRIDLSNKNRLVEQLNQELIGIKEKDLKVANDEVNKLSKALADKKSKNAALLRELDETCKDFQTEKHLMLHELKVANEKVSKLQTLYNEEVGKTVALNSDLKQLRIQLDAKKEDRDSFLNEIRIDLNKKIQLVEQLNQDLIDIKGENEQLRAENDTLSDKVKIMASMEAELKKAEKTVEELESRNSNLQARLLELATTEENLKEATSHVDNIKHELELKVEKLSSTLENMSVSLESARIDNTALQSENLELSNKIECLCELANHTIVKAENDLKPTAEDNIESRYQVLLHNIKQLYTSREHVEERTFKLAADLETSNEKNSELSDKLSKLSLRLEILEKENVELGNDVKDLQTAYDSVRSERDALQLENENALTSLQQMQARQNEILHEHIVAQDNLKERIESYESQLSEKITIIEKLESQLESVSNKDENKHKEFTVQKAQFQELKDQFRTLEKQLTVEREHNDKLKKDIAIFQAKLFKNRQITEEKEKQWQEEQSKLQEEIRMAESRIKDNRLELEGKLEKMKNKMKTLYNDEVTKIKSKQERELAEYRAKLESVLTKNEKYEAHVQKLAKHVFNLNETILELQKQNKFMETKLKDQESIPASSLRRQSQFASQMIGSNLRMEDEEGELFNNTYLADLKSGRMSPFGRESVSVNELHYRNSLAPPHLRSTYIAQYPDHHLREEDIKDVPINLDDSLSSLLNAGQRKKMSGTTSYKKPGPPTPSKNGGRLSFGGGEREILKECNDISVTNSKRGTPSKFRTLFSSSKIKDELLTLLLDRRTPHGKRRKSITRPLHYQQFTSTPRKSRIHFDQRRHLEQLMSTESCGSDIGIVPIDAAGKKPSALVAEKDTATEKFTRWRQSKLPSTDSCTTSDSNSPCVAEKEDAVFVETLHKVSIHNRRDRRSSFVLRGNMFANRKAAHNSSARENLRSKAKFQRLIHFNKFRKSLCNESLIKLRKSILDRLSSIDPALASSKELLSGEQSCNADQIVWPTRDSIERNVTDGDSQLFERLLTLKESNAPFEVSDINLTPNSLSRQTSLKTLYSGSVIKNRKIPHVNTTSIEKTPESSRNRKITVVHIIRNWHKLDLFVKSILIVSFIILVANILIGIAPAK